MAIRLIALDMDGTLLTTDKRITDTNRQALEDAAARGITLAFATGRSVCEMKELTRALPLFHWAILVNGAIVRDLSTGETLDSGTMKMADVRKIAQAMAPWHPVVEVFAGDEIITGQSLYDHAEAYCKGWLLRMLRDTRTPVPDMDAFLQTYDGPVGKLHLLFESAALREQAKVLAQTLPYDLTHLLPNNLEFTPQGVHKGAGLAHLAKRLGIPMEETLAMGDSSNDVEMLRMAGVGLAMENAEDEIKAQARLIAPDNDHDGVAWAIRKYALNDA